MQDIINVVVLVVLGLTLLWVLGTTYDFINEGRKYFERENDKAKAIEETQEGEGK